MGERVGVVYQESKEMLQLILSLSRLVAFERTYYCTNLSILFGMSMLIAMHRGCQLLLGHPNKALREALVKAAIPREINI